MRSFMETGFIGREVIKKPQCPFCGMNVEAPQELQTRRPGDMPVGSCSCGAVYSYDATGRNLGSAFIEALVFSCNMDWDLAWGLLPEDDYLESLVENYDHESHQIIPGRVYEGRRISGALYFVRLHSDIQEAASPGVQRKLDRSAPASEKPAAKTPASKGFSRQTVEELVQSYQIGPLLDLAAQDRRITRDLQRLLYSGDPLTRRRTADMLGRVCGIIARSNPGTVSNIMQRFFNSLSDTGSSSWGAVEAIGEIIGNSPDLFAGYIPALYQYLGDEILRPRVLEAVGRTAAVRPDLVRSATFRLLPFLGHPDHVTRGQAARLFGWLGSPEAVADLEKIRRDDREISIYDNGDIKTVTVGQLASEALERIRLFSNG